jgi:hypothetical protein
LGIYFKNYPISIVALLILATLSIISDPATAAGNQRLETPSVMTGKLPPRPDTCAQKSRELRDAGKPGNFTCTRSSSLDFSQSPAAKSPAAAGPSSRICQLLSDDMFGQLKKREECVKLNQGILIFEKDKPVGEYDFHVTIYSATSNTSLRSTIRGVSAIPACSYNRLFKVTSSSTPYFHPQVARKYARVHLP